MKNSFNFTKYLLAFFSLSIVFAVASAYSVKKGFEADPELIAKIQSKYNVRVSLNGITMNEPNDQVNITEKFWTFPATTKKITIKSIQGRYSLRAGHDKEIKITASGRVDSEIAENLLKLENNDSEVILAEPSGELASDLEINIELPEKFSENIEFYTRSGEVSVENLQLDSLLIKSISGEVILNNTKVTDLEIETTSSEIRTFATSIKNLKVKSISGDLELENIIPLNIIGESVSGNFDLRLRDKSSMQFFLKTVSGNITNSLGSEKSAKNKVEIKTVSGDINIE